MSVAAPAAENPAPFVAAVAGPKARLRVDDLSDSVRNFAILIHLSPLTYLVAGPLALCFPLILWIVRKDDSVYLDDHGREVVNFGISFIIWNFVLGITIVGIILLPVLWVVAIVNLIRGATAANRSEYFRYPVTIRFLS